MSNVFGKHPSRNRAALQYTLGRFDEAFEDYNLVLEHGDPGSYIYYIAQTQAKFLANRPSREEIEATQSAFEAEMGGDGDAGAREDEGEDGSGEDAGASGEDDGEGGDGNGGEGDAGGDG